MNLNDYLHKKQITSLDFSKRVGCSKSAIDKWRQRTRKIPEPRWIEKIFVATHGRVKLADWYNVKD